MTLDYKPSEEFEVSKLQSLLDFDVTTGAKELWLIQCPTSHVCSEKEFSKLKLCGETITDADMLEKTFSTFHTSNVVLQQQYREKGFSTYAALISCLLLAEQNNELLMMNNMALKISRRVSLVRFPKPEELLETMKVKTKRKLAGAAVTSSSVRNSNPAQSSRRKSGQSSLRHSTSNSQKSVFPSSSTKTLMSSSKRKHSEPSSSKHHSSATTVPGSSDRSDKSKKKVKTEN
ncbi:unnamed protein product [Brassica rapa subsp. trilocularis]